jgi:uncharacterized DUF497 family protein
VEYVFEWDPRKATLNLRKHGVGFEQGATIFLDAEAISIPDEEHSEQEDRWVTIGLDASARLLVVIHTFEEIDSSRCRLRLISARKATKKEERQYRRAKR